MTERYRSVNASTMPVSVGLISVITTRVVTSSAPSMRMLTMPLVSSD